MAKSRRVTTTKRTTAARRSANKLAEASGVPKNIKISRGHGHRTVNAPKPLY